MNRARMLASALLAAGLPLCAWFLLPPCGLKHLAQHPAMSAPAAAALLLALGVLALALPEAADRPWRLGEPAFAAGAACALLAVTYAALPLCGLADDLRTWLQGGDLPPLFTACSLLFSGAALLFLQRPAWAVAAYRQLRTLAPLFLVLAFALPPLDLALTAPLVHTRDYYCESSLRAKLRTLAMAEEYYRRTAGRFGTLEQLASPQFFPPLLRPEESNPRGYRLDLQLGPDGQSYACRASPGRYFTEDPPCAHDFLGARHFWLDKSGIIRFSPGPQEADSNSTPLD